MDTSRSVLIAGLGGSAIVAIGLIVAASIMSTPPEQSKLPTISRIKEQIIAGDERVFNVTELEVSPTCGAIRFNVFHRDAGAVAHQTRVVYYRDMGGVYRYKGGDPVGERGEVWRGNTEIWP